MMAAPSLGVTHEQSRQRETLDSITRRPVKLLKYLETQLKTSTTNTKLNDKQWNWRVEDRNYQNVDRLVRLQQILEEKQQKSGISITQGD
jgi:hypothetical protein